MGKRKVQQAGLLDGADPMEEDRVSNDSQRSHIVPAHASVRQAGLADRCGIKPQLLYEEWPAEDWRDTMDCSVEEREAFYAKHGADPAMGTIGHAHLAV